MTGEKVAYKIKSPGINLNGRLGENNMDVLPKHIAIIPDGNRRWATSLGKSPWEGHFEGAKNTEKIIERAKKLHIQYLSIWGSSEENLSKRPLVEKKALLEIYLKNFKRLIGGDEVFRDQVRISIIGKWREQFPVPLVKLLEECIEKTKKHRRYFLNFFLAYNGDNEMISAVEKIVGQYKDPSLITGEIIKENLWTRDLPPVDFLIRTGGEPHLSAGFMMWDIANAQLFFSEKNYPDFGPDAFEKAIQEYGERERRLGK